MAVYIICPCCHRKRPVRPHPGYNKFDAGRETLGYLSDRVSIAHHQLPAYGASSATYTLVACSGIIGR